MTHEFTFPGGSAIITTTTGGTADEPDFGVEGPDDDSPFKGDACSVFAAEILRLAHAGTCKWTQQGEQWEESECWEADCGGAFRLDESTPTENGMKFCCYCGKKLEEVPWTEPEEETEDVHD